MTQLTEAILRESLRAELTSRPRTRAPHGSGTASAVLIPLFEEDGDVHVWLVRRAEGLRKHSGQVAFPGGKFETEDISLMVTALREAEEEIGLARTAIDVLGPLDDLRTGTGYTITPYVGWVPRALTLQANPTEVARVFTAPLRTFLKPAPAGLLGMLPRFGYHVDGEFVWGATATIARALGDIVGKITRIGAAQ